MEPEVIILYSAIGLLLIHLAIEVCPPRPRDHTVRKKEDTDSV